MRTNYRILAYLCIVIHGKALKTQSSFKVYDDNNIFIILFLVSITDDTGKQSLDNDEYIEVSD